MTVLEQQITGARVSPQIIDQTAHGQAGEPWYLAYTRPRSEAVAAQQLARQGYEAYLPLYKTLKRGPEGLLPQRSPMFPRYLFVRAGRPGQSMAPVRSTVGVSHIVRFGFTPATVSDALLSALRSFEQQREQASPESLASLKPGRRVAVCDGPLKGLEGLVSATACKRVTVLLDVLGRQTRVSVPDHQLEALAA
jgi:transcriptional antiterminator RfaH